MKFPKCGPYWIEYTLCMGCEEELREQQTKKCYVTKENKLKMKSLKNKTHGGDRI